MEEIVMKTYLIRFGSNSLAKKVKLDSKGYREALEMGYQIIPLKWEKN